MTQTCKDTYCEELVMSLTDYEGESTFSKTTKHDSTGVVCFPSIPDPLGLCFFHRKKAEGAFGDPSAPFNPFWVNPPKGLKPKKTKRSGGPHKRRKQNGNLRVQW